MVAVTLALAPYAGLALWHQRRRARRAWFLVEAHRLRSRVGAGEAAAPMRLFHLSIAYLTLLFAVIAITALLPRRLTMAVTAGRARPRWTILLRPRWLAWHGFAVLATAGMLYLGDWQLHRAESGQRAELGVHVRVAAVRDIRRVLLGEDAARRTQESGGRRDARAVWGDRDDRTRPTWRQVRWRLPRTPTWSG